MDDSAFPMDSDFIPSVNQSNFMDWGEKQNEEEPDTFRLRSYSGRAMYGKECPGVCVSSADFNAACDQLKVLGVEFSTDQLGRDQIIYARK